MDDAKPLFAKWWGNRPVLFGEFGSPTTDTSTDRTARFNAIKALTASDARFNGGLVWDIASSSYGLFDTSGVARTDVTVPFQTFPISR